MSEFLWNKCFVKGTMRNFLAIYKFLKKTTLSKENVLVLLEFLKNKYFVKGKSPSFALILEK
jgi:hypothetical protein